jgi:alpha-mannosidase
MGRAASAPRFGRRPKEASMSTRPSPAPAAIAAALILVLALRSAPAAGQSGPAKKPAAVPAASAAPRDLTAHLIGHAHIDLSWLWRWEETVADIARYTFKGTLAQMDKVPGLTFAQSQPALYEAIEKSEPELFAAMARKIREGTWAPVGGMWVEPDANMPDGEALARQLLYGKRYFLDKFGVDVKVGWNPDTFGHNWQMPQILRRAGLDSYVFGRCAPAPDPTHFFWWEGLDGSRVLGYVPAGWYNVSLEDGTRKILEAARKNTDMKDFLLLYGAGDHGGGPRDVDLAAMAQYKDDPNEPRLVFDTPEAFLKVAAAKGAAFPVVKRELNFTFPACYTTQALTKKNNRQLEGLLVTAEKFSALAATSGYRDYYPERDIDEAWKIVLRNQFHDILDGSSIGPVYDEVAGFYRQARQRAERALDFSLETIANQIDTRGPGLPVVVYNPLFWERTEPVAADIAVPPDAATAKPWTGTVRLTDASGRDVPVQVIEKRVRSGATLFRVVFLAEGVPSLGYKLYRAVPSGTERPGSDGPKAGLTAGPNELENEFLKVRLDPKTGWIASLYDRAAQREVLAGPGNVLEAIVDEPENMSAWELGLKGPAGRVGEAGAVVEMVESGPVRAVIRVQSRFRDSTFEQDLTLYRGWPRLDVRTRLDWQERNIMIKAAFPLALKDPAARFEIPYGSIARPADGTEVPALRWIDVAESSGEYGAALLNDSKYGFDVKGGVMRLSVVHGPTYPDPEADRGRHELAYALLPHRGDWRAADATRRGLEFNNPLIARTPLVHPGTLPPVHSFVKAGPAGVIVSALKKEMGYAERGLILRLYETRGEKTEARIELPWPVEAREADLIERVTGKVVGSGRTLTVPLAPYEIRTIRLERK